MKVLHLTTHLDMGGITIYILRLAKFLKPLGIETQIFSSGGALEPLFAKDQIPLYIRPVRTKTILQPKLYLQLPYLVRLVREQKIELLHAHTRAMQVLAFWVSRLTGIPVVTTCHGFYKPKLGRRLLPAWGQKVIAISEMVQTHLEKDLGVPAAQIQMIHNGVDVAELDHQFNQIDTLSAKKKFGFSMDAPVVGIVARMVKDKGHEYALQALKILEKDFPRLGLLMAGDGPYRPALETLTQELGLTGRVRFTGTVAEIAEVYRAMDIFVLPATWREGFGLSMIEAMACRKPIIASDIWALSQIIQEKETGLLVKAKDSLALADTLRRLLQSPEQQSSLGEKARQKVLRRFTMERMAREVAGVYRTLTHRQ